MSKFMFSKQNHFCSQFRILNFFSHVIKTAHRRSQYGGWILSYLHQFYIRRYLKSSKNRKFLGQAEICDICVAGRNFMILDIEDHSIRQQRMTHRKTRLCNTPKIRLVFTQMMAQFEGCTWLGPLELLELRHFIKIAKIYTVSKKSLPAFICMI